MTAKTVIDMVHLARYTGGDAKLDAEILRLFDSQAIGLVDRLKEVLLTGDTKSWKEIAHTIKGAARGVGAFALADAAASCEQVGLIDPRAAAEAVKRLGSEADAVQAFIEEVVRS
jgi:HPt (histidine-containing phosphotransfer) domain-containing protein